MLNKKSKIFLLQDIKAWLVHLYQKKLKKKGYKNLLVVDKKKLNLLDQKKVYNYLKKINQI